MFRSKQSKSVYFELINLIAKDPLVPIYTFRFQILCRFLWKCRQPAVYNRYLRTWTVDFYPPRLRNTWKYFWRSWLSCWKNDWGSWNAGCLPAVRKRPTFCWKLRTPNSWTYWAKCQSLMLPSISRTTKWNSHSSSSSVSYLPISSLRTSLSEN